MALRESECLLVRRVADRGIDKNISDSRVRGDRFHRDRRSAGRGNEIGNRDPRDIIEIKRLKRRVRDLELQQEIKRLRQRIRYLELQREMRKVETESSIVVWDEGGDGEEHPFSRHPHRLHEPIYQVCLSDDNPRFDEDGFIPNEEECLLVRRALSGITIQEAEPTEVVWDEREDDSSGEDNDGEEARKEYAKRSTGICDEFLKDKYTVTNGVDTVVMVVNGGVTVTGDENQVNMETPLVSASLKPVNSNFENIDSVAKVGESVNVEENQGDNFVKRFDLVNKLEHNHRNISFNLEKNLVVVDDELYKVMEIKYPSKNNNGDEKNHGEANMEFINNLSRAIQLVTTPFAVSDPNIMPTTWSKVALVRIQDSRTSLFRRRGE